MSLNLKNIISATSLPKDARDKILKFRELVQFPLKVQAAAELLRSHKIEWFGYYSTVNNTGLRTFCDEVNKHAMDNPELYTNAVPKSGATHKLHSLYYKYTVKRGWMFMHPSAIEWTESSNTVNICNVPKPIFYDVVVCAPPVQATAPDSDDVAFNPKIKSTTKTEPPIDIGIGIHEFMSADLSKLEELVTAHMVKESDHKVDALFYGKLGMTLDNTITGRINSKQIAWEEMMREAVIPRKTNINTTQKGNEMQTTLLNKGTTTLGVQVAAAGFASTTVETYNGFNLADASEEQLRTWLTNVAQQKAALKELALDTESAYKVKGYATLSASAEAITKQLDVLAK